MFLLFLLTVAGVLSALLIIISIVNPESDSWTGLALRLFGIFSFIVTIFLSNMVQQ